ncbi:MAG: hypothetical protein MZV63_58350 [Marinilabiliales bacterium]|nr:hypothetical protein [Marinilabiliales bacterium]
MILPDYIQQQFIGSDFGELNHRLVFQLGELQQSGNQPVDFFKSRLIPEMWLISSSLLLSLFRM